MTLRCIHSAPQWRACSYDLQNSKLHAQQMRIDDTCKCTALPLRLGSGLYRHVVELEI